MTAVKFCGLRCKQEIEYAIGLGVDAIGLVFYPPSPRALTMDQAKILVKQIPAFVSIVALVVNMTQDELRQLSQQVAFDVVQFHGDESVEQCQQLAHAIGKRWIKAVAIKPADTHDTILATLHKLADYGASGALLDTYQADKFGGTGVSFDWTKIPNNPPLPIILAGGLTPDNVAMAIAQTGVYGVDVSGGIEKEKGIKCELKMRAFIRQVNNSSSLISA